MNRIVIDGNAVYEIDEACIAKKKGRVRSPDPNRKNEKPSAAGEISGEKQVCKNHLTDRNG